VGATPGFNKLRKLELVRKKLVECGFCKYHQRENKDRQPLDDRYKDHRPRIGKEERSWEMFGVE
jgi:hypothetical protein